MSSVEKQLFFSLVGEAYVYGVSDGEWIKDRCEDDIIEAVIFQSPSKLPPKNLSGRNMTIASSLKTNTQSKSVSCQRNFMPFLKVSDR